MEALKICLVAEGEADIYPRLGPTIEWDTGSAHAIVNEAKGGLVGCGNDQHFRYNKKDLLNPWFIVTCSL